MSFVLPVLELSCAFAFLVFVPLDVWSLLELVASPVLESGLLLTFLVPASVVGAVCPLLWVVLD